jgi:hypothetical protein
MPLTGSARVRKAVSAPLIGCLGTSQEGCLGTYSGRLSRHLLRKAVSAPLKAVSAIDA